MFADEKWKEIRRVGQRAFALTAAHREDAARAVEMLAASGLSLVEAARIAAGQAHAINQRITVSQLRERFLSEPGRKRTRLVYRRPRSAADMKARTNAFATRYGPVLVCEITAPVVREWIGQMAKLAPQTRNNYRRALHAMFAFGVAEGLCTGNPVAEVRSYSVPTRSPSILTVEEAARLVEAASVSDAQAGLLGYAALGLFAGLRAEELRRMDWSAVKLDRRIVTVGPEIAKTGNIRNVHLPDNCRQWLQSCVHKSGPIVPKNFYQRFRDLRKAAGLSVWRGNELRHSFASYHFDLHQNAPLTAAQLGHNSGVHLLFAHYRSLVPLGEGEQYFAICPTDSFGVGLSQTPVTSPSRVA